MDEKTYKTDKYWYRDRKSGKKPYRIRLKQSQTWAKKRKEKENEKECSNKTSEVIQEN